MGIQAKVILHSVNPDGVELITVEVKLHRFILAEVNTHRVLSRNYSSSRAIPFAKIIDMVLNDPAIPVYFGANQKGMQAGAEVEEARKQAALRAWLRGRDRAVETANELIAEGQHKQIVNRVMEPYMWATGIITATEWSNFFALRRHPDAQPEFHALADAIYEAIQGSKPQALDYGEWHLPYVTGFDREELEAASYNLDGLKRISAGRCCRVSYKTHDGKRDPELDVQKCRDLISDGHMSPLEHQATPVRDPHNELPSNFNLWHQYRKDVPYEADFGSRLVG